VWRLPRLHSGAPSRRNDSILSSAVACATRILGRAGCAPRPNGRRGRRLGMDWGCDRVELREETPVAFGRTSHSTNLWKSMWVPARSHTVVAVRRLEGKDSWSRVLLDRGQAADRAGGASHQGEHGARDRVAGRLCPLRKEREKADSSSLDSGGPRRAALHGSPSRADGAGRACFSSISAVLQA
jgi:hypothetical protein